MKLNVKLFADGADKDGMLEIDLDAMSAVALR